MSTLPPMCPHRVRVELGERASAVFHNWASGCADYAPMDDDNALALVAAIREALISQWESDTALCVEQVRIARAAAFEEAAKHAIDHYHISDRLWIELQDMAKASRAKPERGGG